MKENIFYIVATPIGNLKDISLRALEVLKEVDLILCEDTRVTKKLLSFYNIKKPLFSYHQHTSQKKIDYILDLIEKGKKIALVCDAGTPTISDPGFFLIRQIRERFKDKVKITSIPGASAFLCCASLSGFPMEKFLFLGFPPKKKKRKKFFEKIKEFDYPIILYESCHRILKTLEDLKKVAKEREVVVCRELTKMFETVYWGKIEKVIEKIKNDSQKGEFVIILGPKKI